MYLTVVTSGGTREIGYTGISATGGIWYFTGCTNSGAHDGETIADGANVYLSPRNWHTSIAAYGNISANDITGTLGDASRVTIGGVGPNPGVQIAGEAGIRFGNVGASDVLLYRSAGNELTLASGDSMVLEVATIKNSTLWQQFTSFAAPAAGYGRFGLFGDDQATPEGVWRVRYPSGNARPFTRDGYYPLTDAATIGVNAGFGPDFSVTLGGNRTLGQPTNVSEGMVITFAIRQDATGTRTLAYNAAYRFNTTFPSPTLTVTANATDYLRFIYNSTDSKWDCIGIVKA